jgi:Zn-dependent M28 family amino/carboxypeptidase
MRISRTRATLVVALAASASVALAGTPAYAAADNTRLGTKLAREVTVNGVNRQLIALQRIADQNAGIRAAGTPGHDASATYVHDTLARAGWNVTYQDFQIPFFRVLTPAELERTSPDPKTFTEDEVVTFDNSGSGDVTSQVQAIDVQVPPPPTPGANSGCEAADFAGFTAGNIALIQRGTCTFAIKVANALAAGAAAVIIFNEGQPGRTDPFVGDVGDPTTIPVVGISFAEGAHFVELLRSGAPVTARVATDTLAEVRTTRNVIAETPGGRADNVVFAGAHLDSVPAGPGINDNGTGSATLLELALRLADEKVKNKVRLAFWSAEELGDVGSDYYVSQLSFDQQLDIALYLNFDMIGSPNWGEFTYDGDDSDGEGTGPGPFGSAQIETLLNQYITTTKGVPTEGTDFDGRSDYGPFIAVGIPSGGIFTGAEGIKTADQAAKWGGTAGIAYDPCYHAACDNLGNPNRGILDKNADAVAFAVGRYALDTSDINGVGGTGAKARKTAAAAKAARTTVLHRTVATGTAAA